MKRLFTILLIFAIFTVSTVCAFADIDASTDPNAFNYYTNPYYITINANTGLKITDTNNGRILYPGTATNTQNSVVNALYYGSTVILRKASQFTGATAVYDGIRFSYYNTYTNISNIDGYNVKVHFPVYILPQGSTIQESVIPYFSMQFNGEIQECYVTYKLVEYEHTQLVRDGYVLCTDEVKLTDEYEQSVSHVVGTTGGNFFNQDLADDFNIHYNSISEDFTQRCLYDLTFDLYVQLENTGTVSYTTSQTYDTEYTPLNLYDREYRVQATVLGVDFFEWLYDFVDGFLETPVWGDITFGHIFWATLGLSLVLVFLKFFAGG